MGDELNTNLSQINKVQGWKQPIILDFNKPADVNTFLNLKKIGKIHLSSDHIDEALEELYHIVNPSQIDAVSPEEYKQFLKTVAGSDLSKYGKWVYFPWSEVITHFPPQTDLDKLRGSRNRNLITDAEREDLKDNKTIVILGLSVGSNAVDSLLMQGIGSRYILVDMDHLSPTNLNRIRASYDQLGIHKVDVVAKRISELDPYVEQVHYNKGLDDKNLEEIITKYRPDIIIDEIDSLRMKVAVRLRAKEAGIPVLMATDDGDDILLDIERFDMSQDQSILHGILPDSVIEDILSNRQMSRQEMGQIIGKYFVNLDNVPVRMLESLLEVGKTLPSWPQLGGAAVLSGLYLAYACRRILLKQPINSGRFLMGPEEQLNPNINSEEYKTRKADLIKIMTGGR